MTTATSDEGTEPAEGGGTGPAEGKGTEPEGKGTEPEGKGNSEAAKWRTRLRAAEAERGTLAQRVARLQTVEVHRLAGALADPDDLFVFGKVEVADLLDDKGEVDSGKVEQAVVDLLARKPRLAKDYEPDVEGLDGGARQSVSSSGASWGSLLAGARR